MGDAVYGDKNEDTSKMLQTYFVTNICHQHLSSFQRWTKLPQKLKTSRFWFTTILVNPKTILHVGGDSNPDDIEYVTHAEAWQLQPDGSFYISRTKWGEDDWSLYPGVFIL